MDDSLLVAHEEWKRYAVGEKSTNINWTEPTCRPFSSVFHVAHIDYAYEIIAKQVIRSSLIQDASKLNTERISVVWLSPNEWTQGYMYGNIRFHLDWNKLITPNMKFYWVEVMTAYKPEAPRILVSSKDYSDKLAIYNPNIGDGPWWYEKNTGTHYRNGNITLEFMFERDVLLEEVTNYDFVDHHPDYCNKKPSSCGRRLSGTEAGRKFIAGVVGNEIKVGVASFEAAYQDAWFDFVADVKSEEYNYSGSLTDTGTGKAVAKAFLGAYSRGNKTEKKQLAELFSSEKDHLEACAIMIEYRLKGSRNWHLFRTKKEKREAEDF